MYIIIDLCYSRNTSSTVIKSNNIVNSEIIIIFKKS